MRSRVDRPYVDYLSLQLLGQRGWRGFKVRRHVAHIYDVKLLLARLLIASDLIQVTGAFRSATDRQRGGGRMRDSPRRRRRSSFTPVCTSGSCRLCRALLRANGALPGLRAC